MDRTDASHLAVVDVLPAARLAGVRDELDRQRQARMATIDGNDVGPPERAVVEQDLAEIDAAIARIDGGDYGRCTACSSTIPPERLEIMPTAELCVRCQHDQETRAF